MPDKSLKSYSLPHPNLTLNIYFRASNEWREDQANTDTEQSFISGQGTLTTLR